MQILPPGCPVSLGPSAPSAVVTAACIRAGRVTYEVAYWDAGARVEVWVEEFEIEPEGEQEPMRVGFRAEPSQTQDQNKAAGDA